MTEHAAGTPAAPVGPPPGWYNDPAGRPIKRWWDGTGWHPHTRPSAAAPRMAQTPDLSQAGHRAPRPVSPGPWTWAVPAGPAVTLGVAVLTAMATNPASSLSGPIHHRLAHWWCVCVRRRADGRHLPRRQVPGQGRDAPRVITTMRSVAISLLQLHCHPNIAAANRHHARDPQRTLKLLQLAETTLPGPLGRYPDTFPR